MMADTMNGQARGSSASCEYSLWLNPFGEGRREFERLLRSLSVRFATPSFMPHVTVLGRIRASQDEVIECAGKLAALTSPFQVELGRVHGLPEFFRCLFIEIKLQSPLMEIHRHAAEFFGREAECCRYMPHLSLVYGEFKESEKQNIAAEIILSRRHLDVSGIQVARTDHPDPEAWEIIASQAFRHAARNRTS